MIRDNHRSKLGHPLSVAGDFYVINGECISCGLPEAVAPDLISHTEEKYYHCYWKKQPETSSELEQAFKIFDGQEAGCHRYAGTDPAIQNRIGQFSCDHPSLPLVLAIENVLNLSSAYEPGWFARLWHKLFARDETTH